MGSLSSRPKIPKVPPRTAVAYVPQSSSTITRVADPAQDIAAQTPQSESDMRKSNLLRRKRGRLGTIRTGFRGLLSQIVSKRPRKTLLGE